MQRRHAPKLRVLPPPLDRASPEPTVRFEVEPFVAIAPELPSLFRQHHRELGRDPGTVLLDPDYGAFIQLEGMRRLVVLTARTVEDHRLVGYVFNIVGPHLHYKNTFHGVVDMYWLHPRWRRGWTGYKMLKKNKEVMQKLGVIRHALTENLQFTKTPHGKKLRVLLRRLGYVARDVHYACLLQED